MLRIPGFTMGSGVLGLGPVLLTLRLICKMGEEMRRRCQGLE